ncbi:MAG: ISAzo13 family transposase [Candidatus Competibacterales bacterium]
MDKHAIKERFKLLSPFLDEHLRRRIAAAEAMAIGYGGVSVVSRETGLSRGAIALGCEELKHPEKVDKTRIRRKGGGRKQAIVKDPTLKQDLEALIEPLESPEKSPLRWTCKSVRVLASELNAMNHTISHNRIADLLHEMGYTLRANQKTLMGASQANREAQFHYINERVKQYLASGDPVVFVDTKKRELVNNVRPREKRMDERDRHMQELVLLEQGRRPDELDDDEAKSNIGWISVGIDGDTAEFAAESMGRWWTTMGQEAFSRARRVLRVLVVVDSGGSNGQSIALWKRGLLHLVENEDLELTVCHLPPGTSKWNRMEHQLFSFASQSWQDKPMASHRVSINLITGPKVRGGKRGKDSAEENRAEEPYHQEWNYVIRSTSVAASSLETVA